MNNESKNINKTPVDPLYELSVELGGGRNANLTIYYNSKPKELAYQFCKKYNLEYSSLEMLTDKIKELITIHHNLSISQKNKEDNLFYRSTKGVINNQGPLPIEQSVDNKNFCIKCKNGQTKPNIARNSTHKRDNGNKSIDKIKTSKGRKALLISKRNKSNDKLSNEGNNSINHIQKNILLIDMQDKMENDSKTTKSTRKSSSCIDYTAKTTTKGSITTSSKSLNTVGINYSNYSNSANEKHLMSPIRHNKNIALNKMNNQIDQAFVFKCIQRYSAICCNKKKLIHGMN